MAKDKGGNKGGFRPSRRDKAIDAKSRIKAKTDYVCSGCGGSGWVQGLGSKSLTQVSCNVCGGSGSINSG